MVSEIQKMLFVFIKFTTQGNGRHVLGCQGSYFEQLAVEFMNSNYTERKFSSFFGVSLRVIVDVWNFIRCNQNGVTKEHLLWTVYFLKHTPPDEVNKFKVTT